MVILSFPGNFGRDGFVCHCLGRAWTPGMIRAQDWAGKCCMHRTVALACRKISASRAERKIELARALWHRRCCHTQLKGQNVPKEQHTCKWRVILGSHWFRQSIPCITYNSRVWLFLHNVGSCLLLPVLTGSALSSYIGVSCSVLCWLYEVLVPIFLFLPRGWGPRAYTPISRFGWRQ